jgi:hypothetical protein
VQLLVHLSHVLVRASSEHFVSLHDSVSPENAKHEGGDGLLVVGRTLYVVQGQTNTVAVVRLNAAGTSGELVEQRTDPHFQFPTTIARFGKGLYLPNARFDIAPTPDTEYSVVRIDR